MQIEVETFFTYGSIHGLYVSRPDEHTLEDAFFGLMSLEDRVSEFEFINEQQACMKTESGRTFILEVIPVLKIGHHRFEMTPFTLTACGDYV